MQLRHSAAQRVAVVLQALGGRGLALPAALDSVQGVEAGGEDEKLGRREVCGSVRGEGEVVGDECEGVVDGRDFGEVGRGAVAVGNGKVAAVALVVGRFEGHAGERGVRAE